MNAPTRILVATDFSPCSKRAIDFAATLASGLRASLFVLYVSEVPIALVGDHVWARDRFVDADLVEGRARIVEILESLRGRGLAVDGAAVAGHAPQVIVTHADPARFDLLVVGTHGRNWLQRMMTGSVANHVIRTAPIPVLVVPPSRAE
jgi:nucleotide-binding universal stress UspA family protein